MNVLWLAHRDPLNPKAGGAERTIFEVARRLVDGGNEVTLVTAGWKEGKARENITEFNESLSTIINERSRSGKAE